MAEVFVSYAREDRARAEQIAKALQAQGLEVFWDNEIPPGATWADYIESKLTQCKALVVLWSEHSTKSQWVREEARMARDKGVLIPAMIDAAQAPFGFGEVQAANLSGWNGEAGNPEWTRFANAVSNAVNRPLRPATTPPPVAPPPRSPTPQPSAPVSAKTGVATWAWIVGGVVGVIVLLGVVANMMPKSGPNPAQTPGQADQTQTTEQSDQTPQPAGDQNPQQIILAQLQQASGMLSQQGFTQLGAPASGGLQQGQTWNVPVDISAGYEYRLVGVCDRDCSDLDLVLYDPNNQAVAQDTSTDDHPLVAVSPTVTGHYTIQVQMYRCNVAPCYYAVALYGKAPG